MRIIASYNIDEKLYNSAGASHNIALITTEYICGNDMLIHLQFGKNLGIQLKNLLQYSFDKAAVVSDEQFFFKKAYNKKQARPTTRNTFEEKLKKFPKEKTATECEILEDYSYTDKNGQSDMVQIVIRKKDVEMKASIEFKDIDQHENFSCPDWMVKK